MEISDRDFVKNYIPFSELKKLGFFSNEIKRSDYDAIVKRFLEYFGTTKRQYILSQPTFKLQTHPNFIDGKMPSTVDEVGNLNKNGFHLSL